MIRTHESSPPVKGEKNSAAFRSVGQDPEASCPVSRPVLGSPNDRWSSGYLLLIPEMPPCQGPLALLPESSISPTGC